MPFKIAVVGSIGGQFKAVFAKLGALHQKTGFTFILLTGDLLRSSDGASNDDEIEDLLADKITVPVQTYFTLGRSELPPAVRERLEQNDGELCTNLHALGRAGTMKTTDGIVLATLGGDLSSEAPTSDYEPKYTAEDVTALEATKDVSILTTTVWPANLSNGSNIKLPPAVQDSALIAGLCGKIRPKYHFCNSDDFYEREPFFHLRQEGEEDYHITRFISLAPFGNTTKQKWIYAFSLSNESAPVKEIPAGTTPSPFTLAQPQTRPDPAQGQAASNGDHRGQKRKRKAPLEPEKCFFCISNPNVAQHMITSIGDHSYLATAKGPLTEPSTFGMGFPGHILIIPLEHVPTLRKIKAPDERKAARLEAQRFRESLQTMVHDKTKDSEEPLGAVTWEISRERGVHIHWQFLPVPQRLIQDGSLQKMFEDEARTSGCPAFSMAEGRAQPGEEPSEKGDFFQVVLWTAGLERAMTMQLNNAYFDLQLARKVLARALGLEKRVSWQDCVQTEAEETSDAAAFKDAFKPLDFTLE